jgi:hypothetical protein
MAASGPAGLSDLATFKAASTELPGITHVVFFWAEFQDNSKPGSQIDKLFDSLSLKYAESCRFHKV